MQKISRVALILGSLCVVIYLIATGHTKEAEEIGGVLAIALAYLMIYGPL